MVQIDPSQARTVTAEEPNVAVGRQRFLDSIGFWLSLAVLALILIYLIFLGIYFSTSDINAAHLIKNNPDLMDPKNKQVLETVANQTTETRAFVLEISKSILLNLLLPILTALLGYVFGSKQS